MKVLFVGTGEAFGGKANTSILIDDKILLDCGFHTLTQLMKIGFDLNKIEIVYLTHFHADHTFGLPSLLLASQEEGRKKDLEIIGQRGVRNYVGLLLDISYKKSLKDLEFVVKIDEVEDEKEVEGYKLKFGKMEHSIDCYAISLVKDKKVTYTGDGMPTEEVKELAKNSDLLISEAYMNGTKEHSSPLHAAKLAKDSNSKILALVHIYRKINIQKELKIIKDIFNPIIVVQDLDAIWI